MKKDKRKARMSLTSFVMAFMFISSWVVLGVALALTSANVNLGGSISFTATDIYADVTGTVTGTATTNTLTDIHFSASTKSFTTPTSWSNMTLDFQKDTDIVITVNVKNNSPERSIYIGFNDKITATNTDITRKSAGTTVTAFSALEVPKSETKTIEITLHVTDQNKAVSGKFDLGLNLSNNEPAKDASEYPTLSFSVNNTSGTAEVKADDFNKPTGNFVIPSSVIIDGQEYAVTKISDSAFRGCSELTSVTIPVSITSIEDNAFDSCSALTSITIPSSVTSIGMATFSGCSSLTSIHIPAGVTSIEQGAFYGCSALTSIHIPAGVTYIGLTAFQNCSSLTSIIIPSSVTLINEAAFYGCSKLTSVTFENTTGWKAGSTTLSSSDLADTSKAATFLTSTYSSYDWYRS